jgi:hypothetical protein
MASFADTTFENEVRKILNAAIEAETKAVVDGIAPEHYREAVGLIRGLKEALNACDQARRLIAGEPPKTDPGTRRAMAMKNSPGGVV